MNKLLPNTVVRWPAALAGTLVTGAAAGVGSSGCCLNFAKKILLDSYSGVYGPVALVPMLLGWIYPSWPLILLGVEMANAIQNLRLLEAEDRRAGRRAHQRPGGRPAPGVGGRRSPAGRARA